MNFSSKITHSVLCYFESRGEDLGPILESIVFPEEFLRDPSYWIDAQLVEKWLELFSKQYKPLEEADLMTEIGKSVPRLKAWGVLDSVLRIMPRPQDIFNQPEKFVSYFISPEPPVEILQKTPRNVSFNLPLAAEEFPFTVNFLKAAFSSIPVFTGGPYGDCQWSGIHVQLTWQEETPDMLAGQNAEGHRLSPDLMSSIIEQMQASQRELEKKNKELIEKNEQLLSAHLELKANISLQVFNEKMRGLSEFAEVIAKDLGQPADSLSQQVLRMQDYMVRAQQLITIMLAVGKNEQVYREALKRVDWDKTKETYKEVLDEIEMAIKEIRHLSKELNNGSKMMIQNIMIKTQQEAEEGLKADAAYGLRPSVLGARKQVAEDSLACVDLVRSEGPVQQSFFPEL